MGLFGGLTSIVKDIDKWIVSDSLKGADNMEAGTEEDLVLADYRAHAEVTRMMRN